MKDLSGEIRELILFTIQDVMKRIAWIEEQLCEEEPEGEEQ